MQFAQATALHHQLAEAAADAASLPTLVAAAAIIITTVAMVAWKQYLAPRLQARRQAQLQARCEAAVALAGLAPPVSVNYHFLRRCNYRCDFCFHTFTGGTEVLPDVEKEVFPVLRDLHLHGMRKINFSGGEPLLQPKRLEKMIAFCKQDLGVAVTIVTNGSLLEREWLLRNAPFVDYIAISCDTYDEDTSVEIGRTDDLQRGDHVSKVRAAAQLIHKCGIRLRINTVVMTANVDHDFHRFLHQLGPVTRWKVFQMLMVDGENTGSGQSNGRSASHLVLDSARFNEFVARHSDLACMVVESNEDMANSYLILDERLRFLDTSKGSKIPSRPVPEVGVVSALQQSNGYDAAAFERRSGVYEYSRGSAADNAAKQMAAVRDMEDLMG